MRPPRSHFVRASAHALPFPDGHFHCVGTSIPYYRQRKYGDDPAEFGREATPGHYVARVVRAFEGVARVMRPDATLFLNVGDTYDAKTGNLIGVPWMVARAMQRAGWTLRAEIIWAKAISFGDAHAENVRRTVRRAARAEGLSKEAAARVAAAVEPQVGACMPSSVIDRPTTSHETIFMFAGARQYFCDFEPLKEAGKDWGARDRSDWKYASDGYAAGQGKQNGCKDNNFAEKGRNLRTVWTINPQPYHGSGADAAKHYATFPERLISPCIQAGTSDGGCCSVCGDPFVRIVERTPVKRKRPNDLTKRTGEAGTGNKCRNTVSGVATRTLGFRPSCACGPAQGVTTPIPVPCRVLDPFGGIATTAVAGEALGRDVTIVDLYPEYLIEGRKRVLKRRAESANVVSDKSETGKSEMPVDPDQMTIEEVA